MSFINGLKCRECGREYAKQPLAGCEDCFAPLEIDYDYEAILLEMLKELPAGTDRMAELRRRLDSLRAAVQGAQEI